MFVQLHYLTDQKKNREAKKGPKPEISLPEGCDEQLEFLRELKSKKLPFEEAASQIRESLRGDYSDVCCPGKECLCFVLFLAKHKSNEEGVAALRLMKGLAAILREDKDKGKDKGKGQPSPRRSAPKLGAPQSLVEDISDEEGDNLDPSSFKVKEIGLQRPPLIKKLTTISLPTVNKTYL
jgi:hypothetical protein